MGALTEPGRGASARIQPAGGRGRRKRIEERLADWPDHAHRLDVPVHKWMSRERMYAGHARAHERRKAAGRVESGDGFG